MATEVDHIISIARATTQGWSIAQQDHPSNLQSINRECHVRKTIEEAGGTQKPVRKIGMDGFPI